MTIAPTPASPEADSASWRTWHGYAPLDAGMGARLRAASGDLLEGLRRWRLWTYLGFETIKNRAARDDVPSHGSHPSRPPSRRVDHEREVHRR